MDIKQLIADPLDTDLLNFRSQQSKIWTAIPGAIVEWFPETQTATVQVMIQLIRFIPSNTNVYNVTNVNENISVLYDVLVQFPSAGNCSLTFPLNYGDEGLLVFCCKCIDAWWYQGTLHQGVITPSAQPEMRMHDISDATFIPGIKSVPQVIPSISTTELQIRTNEMDGLHPKAYFGLNPSTYNITITTPSLVSVNAPTIDLNATALNITSPLTTIDGNIQLNGSMTSTGDIVAASISADHHTHTSAAPGSPTSPPLP